MTGKSSRNKNEKTAPKLGIRALDTFKKALYFTGKPFYFLLSHALMGILFILYITGHVSRLFLSTFFSVIVEIIKELIIHIVKFRKNISVFLRQTGKKTKRITPKIKVPKLDIKIKPRELFAINKYQIYKLASHLQNFLNFIKIVLLKIILIPLRLKQIKINIPRIKVKLRFRFLTLLILIFLIFPIIYLFYLLKDLPTPRELKDRNINVSTKIYDRNGILLYNVYKDENRSLIKLNDVPLHVRLATIAAEDAEFYQHPGFSLRGISRAVIKNVSEGKLSGGSTITQQLVKNALLTPEKTITRKLREFVLSVWTERVYTKDEILEMYLNEVSYGGTAYGIQEAARTYFDKEVSMLNLPEAALIAGLPKSPTKYSPFGSDPSASIQREKEVLHLMKVNGYITASQEERALKVELNFTQDKTDIKAPHFVMYVRGQLEDTFGKEVVETGGLEVITTLDYNIQKLAEEAVKSEVEKLRNLNVGNGAAVVLAPKTGEILAMVGSKDYFDIESEGNVNVTIQPRQPGSSIKVVNYAYALSHGFTPSTLLSDTPITYKIQGQPDYSPKNYDGTFRGNLTLRSAFAESRNVPAVRVLASYGVTQMIELGKQMGISTWEDKNRFGLSLTLGGGEVKLIELAGVYATVANYGKRMEIQPLISVTNYQNKKLFSNACSDINAINQTLDKLSIGGSNEVYAAEAMEATCKGEDVLDPRISYILTDILRDNEARSPAFGPMSALVIPGHNEIAVKTGTSNNLRDNLTVGYNQNYLVAVWVGNNDNTPMSRIASGVTGASPIFNKIMSTLVSNETNHNWEVPPKLAELPICTLTGTLTCDGCPTKMEWFLEENKPTSSCDPNFIMNLKEVRPQPQILEPAAATVN